MEHTGKRALVLAGGGAKGSYQIGVWRALQALDWTPDIITGASVGTLNGCLFTMGKIQEAEDLWRSLEIHDVLEVPATLKPEELRAFFLDIIRSGGLNVEPLAEMIDRLIDEEAVRTSPIHFGLVMTELGSLRSVQCPIEDIPAGQLKDYMLASSACFPALRPREIDGVKYIDGGWRDNMPLDLAAKMGAAELLGVDVDGIGIVRPNTTGLPTRIVRSHWDLGPTLDFDPARAGRNIALGYFDTLRLFGRCGGTAYAMLPDNEEFLARFAEQYQKLLAEVCARAPEIDLVEKNARLNGLTNIKTQCGDVFELLRSYKAAGEKFSLVVLDPPAFCKSANEVKDAYRGYKDINLLGMKLVKSGGFLATCSCSHYMTLPLFEKMLSEAAKESGRRVRSVEMRSQAPDHPALLNEEETQYLKFFILQIL